MKILIVEHDRKMIVDQKSAIEGLGHDVATADRGRISILKCKEEVFDLVLLSLDLPAEDAMDTLSQLRKSFPDLPIVTTSQENQVESIVDSIRMGANDFLHKPFESSQLQRVLERSGVDRSNGSSTAGAKGRSAKNSGYPQIIDPADESMNEVFATLRKAAKSSAPILLLGETGTGKSLMAKAIHEWGRSQDNPFVLVSCPSLSRELFESTLFGHVKGAFTGAVKDTWGKAAAAENGTLFLDEIGELPKEIQPKLLRFLQDGEFERVGDNRTYRSNARVITATNIDLAKSVKEGEFREDLYFRLGVISVTMAPLRERPKDLERMTRYFFDQFIKETSRADAKLTDKAMEAILGYNWPGNVRELRNAIERAVILSDGHDVHFHDLLPNPDAKAVENADDIGSMTSLEKIEKLHARQVIEKSPSMESAAKVLGVDPATLYRKRKKWKSDEKAEDSAPTDE